MGCAAWPVGSAPGLEHTRYLHRMLLPASRDWVKVAFTCSNNTTLVRIGQGHWQAAGYQANLPAAASAPLMSWFMAATAAAAAACTCSGEGSGPNFS